MPLPLQRGASVSGRLVVVLSVFGLLAPVAPTRGAERLTFDQPQLAGISGFRAFWDTPVVLAGDGLVVETKHTPGGTGPNAVWAPGQRDGGVTRVTVWPRGNRLLFEHAVRPGETGGAAATRIRVRGLASPTIWLDGQPASLDADGCLPLPRSL